MDDLQEVVRPQPEYRMPDLPMKTQSAPLQAARSPRTQTRTPQPTTAQRRANQSGQPRDQIGRYDEKVSKWKQHLPGGSAPVAPTSLKRVKTPARPTAQRRSTSAVARRPALQQQKKRKPTPLPPMHAMLDKPLHQKVGWSVRRWFRRKKKHLKALFSLKG